MSRYTAGLDLGQSADYTALCVVEDTDQREKRKGEDRRRWHVVHLERFPLRTPYPKIASHVANLIRDERLMRPALYVDKTGVGASVTDLLHEYGVEHTGVTITGGASVNYDAAGANVPKKDLIAALEVPFHNDDVAVPRRLRLWPVLRKEMQNFRRKISVNTGHVSFEHWREGDHDDLILAAALALWGAQKPEFELFMERINY